MPAPSVCMPVIPGSFYEFGPFHLTPSKRILLRGTIPVPLSSKGFDILVLLVGNHGRLVTKDQIFEAVWAGSFVKSSSLTVCISALRLSLGEKESGVQHIETVPKAGYRFKVPVQEVQSSVARPTS